MKKLTLLIAAGAGYVLGTRAGRERYEQIKTQANKAWQTAPVQSAKEDVQDAAKQTASTVGAKVAEAATDAKDKVVNTAKSNDDGGAGTSDGAHMRNPDSATNIPRGHA